jgi:hypothetical protein
MANSHIVTKENSIQLDSGGHIDVSLVSLMKRTNRVHSELAMKLSIISREQIVYLTGISLQDIVSNLRDPNLSSWPI